MANNTYVNKVVFGNDTLLDLTSDTVTANDVKSGVTFHDRTGAPLSGQFSPTLITPDNDTPVNLTAGSVVEPTTGGYAVEYLTGLTPSNSSPRFIADGEIYKALDTGYAIESYIDKTPSDSSPASVPSGSIIRPSDSGYLFKTNNFFSDQINVYAVNARGGNNFSKTQTITITKKVSQFVLIVNLWNGASGTYWTNAYKNSVSVNNQSYNDWASLITAIGIANSGTYASGYSAWFAVCTKTLNVNDIVKLDLSSAGANTNYALAIVLLN